MVDGHEFVGVGHRLQQGFRALFAFTRPIDTTLPEQYLSPDLLALFRQLQHSEQEHGLNVLHDVLAQEATTPDDLAAAALLHDVGKVKYPLRVWSKTLGVLIYVFLPGVFQRWSRGSTGHPLQRACVVMVQHPAWGAELVADAGGTERLAWLVAHHADPAAEWPAHPHLALLERLHLADNAN